MTEQHANISDRLRKLGREIDEWSPTETPEACLERMREIAIIREEMTQMDQDLRRIRGREARKLRNFFPTAREAAEYAGMSRGGFETVARK